MAIKSRIDTCRSTHVDVDGTVIFSSPIEFVPTQLLTSWTLTYGPFHIMSALYSSLSRPCAKYRVIFYAWLFRMPTSQCTVERESPLSLRRLFPAMD